ncbi:glycosyltransferase [Roseixanthobacter glucoisosaccharinicivorans]|uniref:glycosyltransferase n=1 Tax=Roseixanthobacter glucoisosaccharinicivorans TaxID=3119923 RepID=UPI00372AC582
MNILHIAPHLGGGVGKAHAALAEAALARVDGAGRGAARHWFALLERPRDTHFVERVRAAGCPVIIAPDPRELAGLVAGADIVQVEWWNHPRLYALLATNALPAMRLAAWVHISGLAPPLIPAGLATCADKVLFTSPCSLKAANLAAALSARPQAFGVVNSGFGFDAPPRPRHPAPTVRMGYLGTLDFIKLHPGFFDMVDAVTHDIRVSLWGTLDPTGEVAARAAAMRHPERVRFEGYASDPRAVLGAIDLFLYPLNPQHYGTGENALVEAMSAGAVPLVWDNPAEAAIVTHDRNGFIANSIEAGAALIERAAGNPERLLRMGAVGARDVARTHAPATSLNQFARHYTDLMEKPPRQRDFAGAFGTDGRAWFLSTLRARTDAAGGEDAAASRFFCGRAEKGSLGHFRSCLPDDASLDTFEGE